MMPTTPGLNHFLLTSLPKAALWRVKHLHVQDLANTAWKFVVADLSDAQLFATLARAGESFASNSNAATLPPKAWAFAIASPPDAQLFAVLVRAAQSASLEG